jgi:hypothetical protein
MSKVHEPLCFLNKKSKKQKTKNKKNRKIERGAAAGYCCAVMCAAGRAEKS